MMIESRFISIIAIISKHLIIRTRINQIWTRQKKDFFSKRIFFDQSKIKIENKEIKIFSKKINNSSKTILKKTTLIESSKKINERSEKLIERRINESWRKKLRKIKTSSSKILKTKSKINSFYDEISSKYKDKYLNDDSKNTIKIHSIAVASFNILSRQKDVKIFAVFMKNLKIQLKKQNNNTVINFKSVMSSKYHYFLNVFFKKKTNILSSHRQHDHCVKLKKNHKSKYEYASLYNLL
jgi:carboxylesterase type B